MDEHREKWFQITNLSSVLPKEIFLLCIFVAGLCSGCATSYQDKIPPELAKQVETSITFPQIKESPDNLKGKFVLLGGQVLKAKRLKNSTQLTILQLPLNDEQEPTTELTQSQGRFIAQQEEFLDPATIPSGSRITLVGELAGSVSRDLDETIYTYPLLNIKNLKVWPKYNSDYDRYGPYYRYPYAYPYPYPYPYWRPYGRFYPYPWYW